MQYTTEQASRIIERAIKIATDANIRVEVDDADARVHLHHEGRLPATATTAAAAAVAAMRQIGVFPIDSNSTVSFTARREPSIPVVCWRDEGDGSIIVSPPTITVYAIADEGGHVTGIGYVDEELADQHADLAGEQVLTIEVMDELPDDLLDDEEE